MSKRTGSVRRLRWFTSSLIFILIVAALFRLWQIGDMPPGLFGDEATDGLDALDVLAGRGRVFFPANFGREGLHMYIVALSINLFGVNPLAVRLPSVLAGIATALATLWLGYEMFVDSPSPVQQPQQPGSWMQRRYLIPLAAAFYVSTSFWHVHFSRFGIRGVFTTTATALTMAALWRALNSRQWRWYVVSGLFMGLGTHFYTASRLVPLMLALFFGGWILISLVGVRQQEHVAGLSQLLVGLGIMFGVATLLFAPLGYYFLTHPGSFMQRAGEISVFGDGLSLATLDTILRAASANLLQFVAPGAGDQAQFYNLPGRAVFDPVTAILALLGVILSIKRWRNPVYSFLLIWLIVMAAPAFIAVDRYPTLPRVLGVIPGLYFFPAIALAGLVMWINRRLQARPGLARVMAMGVFVLALIFHAGLTFNDYFRVWGPSSATAEAFEADMTAAWRWMDDNSPEGDVYLSSDLYKHPTFMFLHEQVPTSEYFSSTNPDLHWFDARWAWPLAAGGSITILVGDSAPLPDYIASLQDIETSVIEGGVLDIVTGQQAVTGPHAIRFDERLVLLDQLLLRPDGLQGQGIIVQVWRIQGPAPEDWIGLQIQSALVGPTGEQWVQASEPLQFRPIEWDDQAIVLLSWQLVPWPDEADIRGTALRVVPDGQVPLLPPGSSEGWIVLPLE